MNGLCACCPQSAASRRLDGYARKLASRSGLVKRESEHMAQADLRRVARATRRIEAALTERDNAICTAWDSGESMRDIAKVAGLSPSRVQQIVAKRRHT